MQNKNNELNETTGPVQLDVLDKELTSSIQNAGVGPVVDIALVFSPVAIALGVLQIFPIRNPIGLMAVVWVANFLMMLLIACVARQRQIAWSGFGIALCRPTARTFLRFVLSTMVVFLLAMLGFVLSGAFVASMLSPEAQADMSGYNFLQGNFPRFIISWLGVLIVSSVGEELVYRGFLLNRLQVLLGSNRPWACGVAVVVSGIVFGLAHYKWGLVGIVQTTAMGLILAAAYVVLKRNLWPLIAAHAIMDTLLLLQMYMA